MSNYTDTQVECVAYLKKLRVVFMAQYDGSIRINTEISTKNAQVQLSSLENRMVKTADKVTSLRSKMNSLKDTKMPTQEYKEIESDISKAERELNKLIEKQAQMQREGKNSGEAWNTLNLRIQASKDYIETARNEMQELVNAGKAFTLGSDTEEFAQLGQQLKYAENDLKVLNQRHDLLLSKQKKNSDSYKKLGDIAKKSLGKISKSVKNSSGLLGTMASRFKGLALSLLIFNQISKAFNAMVSGIKDGFKNLYGENDRFKKSVDNLRASTATLKNSLAAAFAPLVEIAIPYIQKAIEYLTLLIDKLGQFFAMAAGQKTYTKAVKQTTEALKEQGKAANRQLSSLDKLNNLSSGTDTEGIDETHSDMFEETEIPNKWSDILEKLKNMWKTDDFFDFGKCLSEKLTNSLNRIDWKAIRKSAQSIAKKIATFLNGLISPELFGSIGSTLAGAANTGIDFLATFAETFDWENFGDSVAEGFNTFFEEFDVERLEEGIKAFAGGIKDMLIGFFKKVDIDKLTLAITTFFLAAGAKALLSKAISALGPVAAKIALIIAVAKIAFEGGKKLGEYLFPEDKELYQTFSWKEFFDEIASSDAQTLFNALLNTLLEIGVASGSAFATLDKIKQLLTGENLKIEDVFGLAAFFSDEKWKERLGKLKNVFKDAFNSIYKTVVEKLDWILEKLLAITSFSFGDFGDFFGGKKETKKGARASFSSTYESPAMSALSDMEIPGYATGQVIPRTMKQHLAVLGDNTQETEVVSPLSTMKQAFVEAMAEVGMSSGNSGNGNNVYEFSVDGQVFFRIMEKHAAEYKKQHGGKPAFT